MLINCVSFYRYLKQRICIPSHRIFFQDCPIFIWKFTLFTCEEYAFGVKVCSCILASVLVCRNGLINRDQIAIVLYSKEGFEIDFIRVFPTAQLNFSTGWAVEQYDIVVLPNICHTAFDVRIVAAILLRFFDQISAP